MVFRFASKIEARSNEKGLVGLYINQGSSETNMSVRTMLPFSKRRRELYQRMLLRSGMKLVVVGGA